MTRSSRGHGALWLATGLFGLLVLAVPLAVLQLQAPTPGPIVTERPEPPEAVRVLAGVWWRYEHGEEGDPVRFYYFHGDGKGLYRYGRIGHTMTHSFDYDVVGDELVIRFRKTGSEHDVRFRLESGIDTDGEGPAPPRDWLVLSGDPREPGEATTRYFRERPGPIEEHGSIGPTDETSAGPPPAGHMWIDHTPYATGGSGFGLYQFRPAGIDGRGTGWFHRGDFDDWSTESFVYRIRGDRLELRFPVSGERYTTTFTVTEGREGRRLTLSDDPRDFWHPHRYLDVGPSFGAALAPFELDVRRRPTAWP